MNTDGPNLQVLMARVVLIILLLGACVIGVTAFPDLFVPAAFGGITTWAVINSGKEE